MKEPTIQDGENGIRQLEKLRDALCDSRENLPAKFNLAGYDIILDEFAANVLIDALTNEIKSCNEMMIIIKKIRDIPNVIRKSIKQ